MTGYYGHFVSNTPNSDFLNLEFMIPGKPEIYCSLMTIYYLWLKIIALEIFNIFLQVFLIIASNSTVVVNYGHKVN